MQVTLFLIRGLVALVWAAAFATVSDSLTTGAAVLLVLYPGIDLVASLVRPGPDELSVGTAPAEAPQALQVVRS